MEEPDGQLTTEEQTLVNTLSNEQISEIDGMLLSFATNNWKKVAMLVGSTMIGLANRIHGIPDIYYASRIKIMVENGTLESQGDLDYMRFSEVRLH